MLQYQLTLLGAVSKTNYMILSVQKNNNVYSSRLQLAHKCPFTNQPHQTQ